MGNGYVEYYILYLLILVVVVIYRFVTYNIHKMKIRNIRNQRRFAKKNINAHDELRNKMSESVLKYDRNLSLEELAIIENIKQVDKNFNSVLFLKNANSVALELIKTEMIRQTSANYIYEAFNKKWVEVESPRYFLFEEKEDKYILKLRVTKKVVKNGEEVESNTTGVGEFIYEMTFVKGYNKEGKARSCPRCGAPLKEISYGICRYCFKYSDKESKKENIKSNVSKFSYDIPIIKFDKTLPNNCVNCGATLKQELKGLCEYCKSDNNPSDNHWILVEFEKIL